MSRPAPEIPWFVIPGFWYGQGRSEAALRYPGLRRNGGPVDEMCHGSWDFSADRASHPLVAAHIDKTWFGLDAAAHARFNGCLDSPASWGDSEPQIGLGLAWEDSRAQVSINLPAFEGPRRHVRNPRSGPLTRVVDLPVGAMISLDFSTWEQEGPADYYHTMINTVYGDLQSAHPRGEHEPLSELAACAAHGLLAWHWTPEDNDRPGYWVYTAAMDRSVEFNANVNRQTSLGWHFEALGFVGGFAVAHGLAWWGRTNADKESQRIAETCVQRWCHEGISPSGFFRTSYHPGAARTRHGRFANGPDEPGYGSCWLGKPNLAHARTTADASFYLARFLAASIDSPPLWRRALRRSLDAALASQRDDGRHGQIYDVITGAVRQWDGEGGLLWVSAMDAAHDLFADDPAFQARLRASMVAAGTAYAPALRAETLRGAPEDVSLAPTSEDGYNAVMAFARLHHRFGGSQWLELWHHAVRWCVSWRKANNVRFDRRNLLGAGGLRTVGGDYASSNNNHLHVYGLNCLAEFHRLFDITGETWIRDRADDHLAFCAQLLCTTPGRWNGQYGMCTEQFYITDWSIWDHWDPGPHHTQKGTLMGFSHVWCINHILLACEEMDRIGKFR